MLSTKSALPHSENNTHLNMEATYDGKPIFQFDEECPICTEKYFEKAVINSCQHVFCCNCVLTWAEQENSCPLCKTKFTVLQKKVRIMEEGALVEHKVINKRIAHKKQRPPEMTLAEFEQFQYDMEIEELDEWIIDDEVYSEAMDVAPIDHLEVLEQSIAEMTRHSHRERRHHRDNTHTAHRKTKRRKPQSIAMREDIGPVRTRYTRHHQNNNNNNNTNETSTQLVDIVDEVNEEPKYNLRKRRAPKEQTDFIELANEDDVETEQKEPETVPQLPVVNDGCHIDRRTLIASPTKIVKATEVNLPVDMFSDKPGDHDNHDGLSEDEVTEDGGTCVEQIFLGDMDINFVQSKIEDPHKKREGSGKREASDAHPEFTLGAIPFVDEENDKVMPIEGATDLSNASVNNVSINNIVPTDPEPAVDSSSTRDPSTEPPRALKPPSKPQPPFPSAKKTPVLVKPLVDTADEAQSPVKPATPVKPSRGRRRAKPLTPVEPTPVQNLPSPQPLPSHTVELTTPAPTTTSPSKPDIDTTSVPKPSSKSLAPTPSPSKPADTTALKPPSKPQPPTPAVRKTSAAAAAKYLTAPATEKPPSKKTIIKELKSPSNVEPLVGSTKAQILNKITKPQPVPDSEVPIEESIVEPKATENGDSQTTGTPPKRKTLAGRKGKEKRTALSAKLASNRPQPSQVQSPNDKKTTAKLIVNDSSQNVMQTNVIDVQKLKNVSFKKKPTTVPSEPVPQSTEQPADSTRANNNNSLTTAPETASNAANDTAVEPKASDQSAVVTKAKIEAPSSTTDKPTDNVATAEPVAKSILDERVGNLLDRIAPIYTMDVGGYQQHGTMDGIDFSDSAFPTDPESSQHQHIENSEQDNRDQFYRDYHSNDDNGGHQNDSQYQSNYDQSQSRHKRYEHRSNYSTANDYNQYREGSYNSQYHNGRSAYTRGGRYDDKIRPANSFNNRRGSHQNGYGYRGYDRPYDHRPSHANYPRQQHDNRAVQQAGPVQVVQQVVSVQQVPSVPTTTAAVMTAPKTEPREEPKTDGDCFYNRGKRKQKTPEHETNSVARVEPMPISVMPRPSVIKTEVTSVVIKTEVVSAPTLPDPVRVPQAPPPPVSPPTSAPAAAQEPEVSAQPLPRTSVSSQSAVSASKKRSRSRSPSNDREHKRRKVLHDVLDKRRDKDRYSDKEKDKHKDKYRDKEKEKHKDKHRSKDKDKDKRRDKDKDKHRDKDKKDKHERHKDRSHRDKDKEDQRDKEESKKVDNDKQNSVSRDSEQLVQSTSDPKPIVEPSVVPVSLAKKALRSVIMLGDGTKISPAKSSTIVARKNGETSVTPIKKKRLVSKVSVPQQ